MVRWICLSSLVGVVLLAGCNNSKPDSSASDQQPAAAAKDNKSQNVMADQTEAGASGLQYEELIEAAGDERLLTAYKNVESGLQNDPGNPMAAMQRVAIVYTAARMFLSKQDRDNAMQAIDAAYRLAQDVVANGPAPTTQEMGLLKQIYYNAACSQSLRDDAKTAQQTLEQAIKWGWTDMDQVSKDPDLANVRALPGFDALLKQWTETARKAVLEQGREELAGGETFPFDFQLTDIDGKELKLADYRGKVVIVDIWGTWCPPCRAEIPSFVKLQEKYGPDGLQIIGLNYEHAQGDAALQGVKDFVEQQSMNYLCAMGTPEVRSQVPSFQGYPTTLFIDRAGEVRLKLVGAHPYDSLEAIVLALFAEDTGRG